MVSYSPEVVFHFIADIRNFRRFMPSASFSDIDLKEDSCSFRVDTLGKVNVKISEKVIYSKIVFSASALEQNNFLITVFLSETQNRHSEIKLTFEAEMNQMLKMVASGFVIQFLDTLVDEMGKFNGWNDIMEENQPL